MKYKKIFSYFMTLIFCLSGLIYQIYKLSDMYFKYPTNTLLYLQVPQLADSPAITICWRYADILDLNQLRLKYPTFDLNHTHSKIRTEEMSAKFEQKLTVAEIFDFRNRTKFSNTAKFGALRNSPPKRTQMAAAVMQISTCPDTTWAIIFATISS